MSSDAEQRKEKQAKGTRKALRDAGKDVRIHPNNDPSRMEYMFEADVVLVRDGDVDAVRRALHQLGHDNWTFKRNTPIKGVATLPVPAGTDVDALCSEIDGAAGVDGIAMPDHVVHITTAGCCPATEPVRSGPNPDPAVSTDPVADGRNVTVVVVDSGRSQLGEQGHNWLTNIAGQWEQPQVGIYTGHGTFVTGVLRALAPKCNVDVKALLIVAGAVVESDLAVDLLSAVQGDPPVICMSAGTTTRGGFPPIVLEAVCAELERRGKTVLVAAAGNDGGTSYFYPAAFSRRWNSVVSVGAGDVTGTLAPYSNYGWPTVYARGTDVVNAYPNITYYYQNPAAVGNITQATFVNGMALWSGTSFSTPLVAGLLAAQISRTGSPPDQAWKDLYSKAVGKPFGKWLDPGAANFPP
jgi:Subtilase family